MHITKLKKSWKFVIYPILLVMINLLIIKFVFKNFMSSLDLDAVLLEKAPQFDANIKSIFTKESDIENGTLNANEIVFPKNNTEYGKFEIKSVEMSAPLIFGDCSDALKQGVGQYNGSYIPGYGGTILTTGHNHAFPQIEKVAIGDVIKITTTYGVYKYKVSDIKIIHENEYKSLTIKDNKEQLIYYTCYPFTSLADTSSRYFIYADYISGPQILR